MLPRRSPLPAGKLRVLLRFLLALAFLLPGPALAALQSKLLVSSLPRPAAVFLDGERKGETPLTLEVAPGRHTLRLEKEGYAPVTVELDLLPGEARSVTLTLERSSSAADHEITLFTPERRPFSAMDEAMLNELEQLGFQIDREIHRSNPEPNIKVGKGNLELAQQVLAVVHRYYSGSFEIKEIFAEKSPDVFINLGSATEIGPRPSTNLAEHTVIIFTPQDRSFNAADRRLIAELGQLGFKVQNQPGGGGSNPDASIKVGRGNQAMGEQVQSVMRRCYDQPFTVRDIFDAGDTDIYVNLGQDARPLPACATDRPAEADEAPGERIDRSSQRVVIFTPEGREFTAADRALVADLQALRFQVQEQPGSGGSNPTSNIKVARGNAGIGVLVQSLMRLCYEGPFTILEAFDTGSPDIFVNLGDGAVPRPECSSTLHRQKTAGPGHPDRHPRNYYEITLFTPNSRKYSDVDTEMMDELAGLGYRLDRRPLESNPTANIKVAKGDRAIAEEINVVIKKYYQHDFEILEIFNEKDRDVFINLGEKTDGSDDLLVEHGEIYGKYRLRFFTPRARQLSQHELKLQKIFRRMGFLVEEDPLASNGTASIKFGADQREVAELVSKVIEEELGRSFEALPVFQEGDTDVFVDLGPDVKAEQDLGEAAAEAPAAADARPEQFKVTLFTPESRQLNDSDLKILQTLKELGFQVVDDRSGGGGSNKQSNVKVGRGYRRIGELVREAARGCYDQQFELLEVFEPGDRDVYINLGEDADQRMKCGKTRL